MSEQSLWYLENIDVTGIFCPKKMSTNLHDDHVKKYKKNEYIYLPDQTSDKIFFINKGRVKIGTFSDSGKEITKAILEEGQVFGELSIIGEEKRRDFAITMSETEICGIGTRNGIQIRVFSFQRLSK